MNKNKGLLALAALGAFAYYKYNKMTPEEKADIKDSLKQTGQKIVDNLPGELKGIFGDKLQSTEKTTTTTSADNA